MVWLATADSQRRLIKDGDLFYSERIIELLDRRYNFVVSSPSDAFILEVDRFFIWLASDPLVIPYALQIQRERQREYEIFQQTCRLTEARAVILEQGLLELAPVMDDRSKEFTFRPLFPNEEYQTSFRRFADILLGKEQGNEGVTLGGSQYDDRTKAGKLIEILQRRLAEYIQSNHGDQNPVHAALDELRISVRLLADEHEHNYRAWVNYDRVSPGRALIALSELHEQINPAPPKTADELLASLGEKLIQRWGTDYIRRAVYQGPVTDERRTQVTSFLARIYEEIRALIGSTLSHQELIGRFKSRCMWYDRDRLVSLIEGLKEPGDQQEALRKKANREDRLALELAKYLFDNGVTVLVRSRFANLEPDILGPFDRPIVVETKASDHGMRQEIIDGIAQLHAYMNNFEASKFHVDEGYYVIFRLAGPIYDLPLTIRRRYTIHTVVIDLGPGSVSGRHQPKPIHISEEELIQAIDKLDA
jgi:hypothetical protein